MELAHVYVDLEKLTQALLDRIPAEETFALLVIHDDGFDLVDCCNESNYYYRAKTQVIEYESKQSLKDEIKELKAKLKLLSKYPDATSEFDYGGES